jgi:hypothetical protein
MISLENDAYSVFIYHDHENRIPERLLSGAAGTGGADVLAVAAIG